MAEFSMEIAGKTARIRSLFDSTPHYFRPYLTENAPDFTICIAEENLRFEQAELDQEAREEGFRLRIFTDPFLERAAIQRAFAEYLFDYDTLLLHGSTIAVDGNAYLFTARSGTGKSTHTRLWREVFGQRALMINDDKPFLRLGSGEITAFGSPWSGKHGLDTNMAAPLRGICLLERGQDNQIRPLEPADLLPMLQKQAYAPMDPEKFPKFSAMLQTLAQQIPLWRMTCTKDPEAARIAFAAMSAAL